MTAERADVAAMNAVLAPRADPVRAPARTLPLRWFVRFAGPAGAANSLRAGAARRCATKGSFVTRSRSRVLL